MELFENNHLKKIYENFISNTIFTMFDCKYCNLQNCVVHYKFDCSCKNCRVIRCKNCQNFNTELDILMYAANKEARTYIFNYVRDFFTISDTTLNFFFKYNKGNTINFEDIHCITWDLRKFHGTKKGELVETLSKTMSFIVKLNRGKRFFKYNL